MLEPALFIRSNWRLAILSSARTKGLLSHSSHPADSVPLCHVFRVGGLSPPEHLLALTHFLETSCCGVSFPPCQLQLLFASYRHSRGGHNEVGIVPTGIYIKSLSFAERGYGHGPPPPCGASVFLFVKWVLAGRSSRAATESASVLGPGGCSPLVRAVLTAWVSAVQLVLRALL